MIPALLLFLSPVQARGEAMDAPPSMDAYYHYILGYEAELANR